MISVLIEFFAISHSGRSDRSKSELPFSAFVCIKYSISIHILAMVCHLKRTITCKVGIVLILENHTLYQTDLSDMIDLLIVKNPVVQIGQTPSHPVSVDLSHPSRNGCVERLMRDSTTIERLSVRGAVSV